MFIDEMRKMLDDERGLPISAIIFDNNLNIIVKSNNKPKLKKDKILKPQQHAEWLCFNEMHNKKMQKKGLNLLITTTPCNDCVRRIRNEFNFENILYLFEKTHQYLHKKPNDDWKKLNNFSKYVNSIYYKDDEQDDIEYIWKIWDKANYDNSKKTLKKLK